MLKKSVITYIILCLIILAACGKRGPLKPPNAIYPNPPEGLSAKIVTGAGLVLSFKLPKKMSNGTDFDDYNGIELYRAYALDENGNEVCTSCDDSYKIIYKGDAKVSKKGNINLALKKVGLKGRIIYYKVRVLSRKHGLSGYSAPVKYNNKNWKFEGE